jgi:hypothetical protein
MSDINPTELDALVDLVVARLRGQLPGGGHFPIPGGESDLERPPVIGPRPEQLPDLFPRHTLGIAGMELTQSIQHHGAAGGSFGADNSVPLVALKTMVARVYPYLRPGFAVSGTSPTERVTGELVLSSGHQVIYRTAPTRAAGTRVGRQADLDRRLWDQEITGMMPGSTMGTLEVVHSNAPLNFIIPAWYCRRGRLHIAVRIWPVDQGPGSTISATFSQYVELIDVRAPRVALVRINWDNGMGTVTSPTDADMLDTVRLAERMLPFPYFETTILGAEIDESGNFAATATGGGCNTEWQDLLRKLNWTRMWTSLFGLGDLVYGMVPQVAIPPGTTQLNSGCRIESAAGFVGFPGTFAHELGHYFDRAHVAVADDPTNDPDYPRYGGRARSIGEVGIDTGTSPPTLYDPARSDDIMSYGNNKWISPYTYQALLDARHDHQSVRASAGRVRPWLILDLRLHRTAEGLSRLEVRRAARVDAPGSVSAAGRAAAVSPLSMDLLAADGRILTTHHCRYVRPQGGGCACRGTATDVPFDREPYIDFQEAVEWPGERVASIAFHRGRAPVAVVEVGEAPRVDIGAPERAGDRMHVRVYADHPRDKPTVAVLFSGDDGQTWQAVAFDPPDGKVSVSVDHLPGGERCRFRVIATAELQAAVADTDPFELPRQGRRLHLNLPSDACEVPPGRIVLQALLDTRGLGGVSPDEVRWQSSLQGDVGLGFSIAPELEAGEHEITVSVPDGLGGVLSQRGIIVVGGRPMPGLG